jgi:hypothetical protein
MKKLITLLLLFTLVGFLSGNQVIITNDYQYIVSTGKTYNFSNGNESNNVKYDRTNKIQIQNNKVLADPLKYHYAFFWDEADSFIGYYKTNKGIATNGEYLGQVNTQSIPLPLNAYSFALVRYDNDYEVINGITIEDIFIDSDNYFDNDTEWNPLNTQTLNEVFNDFERPFHSIINGIATGNVYTSTGGMSVLFNDANIYTIGDSYYFRIKYQQSALGTQAPRLRYGATNLQTFSNSIFLQDLSYKLVGIFDAVNRHNTRVYVDVGESITIYFYGMLNLTTFGIDNLTITEIDNFYNLFENININNYIYTGYSTNFINPTFGFDNKLLNLTDIFGVGNEPNETTIEGYYDDYLEYLEYLYVCCNIFATQTISFETIYFDDGVSTEIEQLGSILIFTLIGFTLMIFGFASKRRIFNLLAVGAFVVLGFLLIEFVGFIIILFGLIFVNVYYTFFGEL